MAFLLTSKFGFRQENMRLLLDDNPNFNERPTRQNMMEGFRWLIAGCQPGDSLFFHYSGQSPWNYSWHTHNQTVSSRLKAMLACLPLVALLCQSCSRVEGVVILISQKVSLISRGRSPSPNSKSALCFIAGHGSQSRDASGDEADGMNETLCPTDFQQAGQIIDDEINQALINLVPQGVSPHARCRDLYLESPWI